MMQGDIILQEEDELHMSSNEFRVRLEGVYVREVGRVMAVLKPTHPVLAQLTPEDIQEGGPVYRYIFLGKYSCWSCEGWRRAWCRTITQLPLFLLTGNTA